MKLTVKDLAGKKTEVEVDPSITVSPGDFFEPISKHANENDAFGLTLCQS